MTVQQSATEKRRGHRFDPEQKLRIVKEWKATGSRVEVAKKYGIHPRTLYRWKKVSKHDAKGGFERNGLGGNAKDKNRFSFNDLIQIFGIAEDHIELCIENGLVLQSEKCKEESVYSRLDVVRLETFNRGVKCGYTPEELGLLIGFVDESKNDFARINDCRKFAVKRLHELQAAKTAEFSLDQIILKCDIALVSGYLNQLDKLAVEHETLSPEDIKSPVSEPLFLGTKHFNDIEVEHPNPIDIRDVNRVEAEDERLFREYSDFGFYEPKECGDERKNTIVMDHRTVRKLRQGVQEERHSDSYEEHSFYYTVKDIVVRSKKGYLAKRFSLMRKGAANWVKEQFKTLKLENFRETEKRVGQDKRRKNLGFTATMASIFVAVIILTTYMIFSHGRSQYNSFRETTGNNSVGMIYAQGMENKWIGDLEDKELTLFSKNTSAFKAETLSVGFNRVSNTEALTTGRRKTSHVDDIENFIVPELHNSGESKSVEPLVSAKSGTEYFRSTGNDIFGFTEVNDQIGLVSGLAEQETLKSSPNELLNANEKITIHFGRNSKTIPPESRESLERLMRSLSSHDRIVIRGYTDSSGDYEYNVYLSKVRAQLVEKFLVERGVNSENVETYGLGPMHPIQSNDTPSGREANRRVEIEIRRSS